MQCSCKAKLDAKGRVEVHVARSDEESESETKEDDESEGEFVTERKEPVPRWEALSENKAVWEQLYKQLGLEVDSSG